MVVGIFDALRLTAQVTAAPTFTPDVTAADTYYPTTVVTGWWDSTVLPVSRADAMTVPAIARARNIICGTVGSLPIQRYDAAGRRLDPSPLFTQPDPYSPRSTTYTWLADSIMFYGVGYEQVLSVFPDGRPEQVRWIDPLRVSARFNDNSTIIIGYNVDGKPVPTTGVGSIIAYQGPDEGLLRRASRTIRTAIALETAAKNAADEPIPQTVIRNTGPDKPANKVTEILDMWKIFRQSRATAFLNSGLDFEVVGFDPKSTQLVEARQFHATEIARAAGIPAWYVNAESGSMTYSNTEQERRTLVDFSLRPILSAIEDRSSMPDMQPPGVHIRFDLDDFLRGNALERAQINQILLTNGVITVQQWQSMEDLTPSGGTA